MAELYRDWLYVLQVGQIHEKFEMTPELAARSLGMFYGHEYTSEEREAVMQALRKDANVPINILGFMTAQMEKDFVTIMKGYYRNPLWDY